jgi:hypothetical protein
MTAAVLAALVAAADAQPASALAADRTAAFRGQVEADWLLQEKYRAPKPEPVPATTTRARLITWMDTYAQRSGSFSDEQEELLVELREDCAEFLVDRAKPPGPAK